MTATSGIPSVARLVAVNAVIRLAAAASGQLSAFLLAERVAGVATGASLVGAIGACFFVAELVGAPIAGCAGDARGQLRVLSFGPLFGAVSGLVAALAASGPLGLALFAAVLLVARSVEGLSAACAVPTTLTLLARATERDAARRTRVMALFEVTSLVAMIAGYVVAGVVWDAAGARALFVVPLAYVGARLLVGRAPRAAGHTPSGPVGSRSVLRVAAALAREPANVSFAVAWLAVNAVVGLWLQQAPYLLKLPQRSATQSIVGGFTGSEIGYVFGVWGATFLAGIAIWSALGARVGRRPAFALSLAAMLGVVACLALANHGAGHWALFLAAGFVLVESGFTPAALAHLADLTGRHDAQRGAALGLYSALLGTGQLLGSALGAPFAARWQMDGVLSLTALLAVFSLLGVWRMGASPGSSQRDNHRQAA